MKQITFKGRHLFIACICVFVLIGYFVIVGSSVHPGWNGVGRSRVYFQPGTGVLCDQWLTLGNETYYIDANGHPRTGWQKAAGHWYYFDSSGIMCTGWCKW